MVEEVEFVFSLPSRMYREYEICSQYVDVDVGAKIRESLPSILLFKSHRSTVEAVASWFKDSFMRWVPRGGWTPDPVTCRRCGEEMDMDVMVAASNWKGEEWNANWEFIRIEKWRCKCGNRFQLPRYNSFTELLYTREGRCGEWARLYTAMLLAIGYRARLVIDWFNDHVWTEVHINIDGVKRWVMVDVSNGLIDKPLTYENWSKEFYYIFAFEPAGEVIDVTERYTAKMTETLNRRQYGDRVERYIRDFNSFVEEEL